HDAGNRAVQIHAHDARVHPCRRVVLGIEQRLETGVAAVRLETRRDADAGEPSRAARAIALFDEGRVVDRCERLIEHRVVIAGIVSRAARNAVRKLVLAYEVPPPYFDRIDAEVARDAIERALKREVGRRLAEAAYSLLGRFVREHGDRLVLDGSDAIGSADRGDRLA